MIQRLSQYIPSILLHVFAHVDTGSSLQMGSHLLSYSEQSAVTFLVRKAQVDNSRWYRWQYRGHGLNWLRGYLGNCGPSCLDGIFMCSTVPSRVEAALPDDKWQHLTSCVRFVKGEEERKWLLSLALLWKTIIPRNAVMSNP